MNISLALLMLAGFAGAFLAGGYVWKERHKNVHKTVTEDINRHLPFPEEDEVKKELISAARR